MNFFTIFVLLSAITALLYIVMRKTIPLLVRKKATNQLAALLFPEGNGQKQEMMKTFHKITCARFKDEELLDYYYKIKGLRIMGKSSKLNFCLKNYLFSPTDIKLNYFEQCRFYETFLHSSRTLVKKRQVIYYEPPRRLTSVKPHFLEINKVMR